MNQLARDTIKFSQSTISYLGETFGDLGVPLKEGDTVNGWKVTSPFGVRVAPCKGCSSFHRGTDLAVSPGELLYVPTPPSVKAEVRCRQPGETGGGGIVAEILVPERGTLYQALHLSSCQSGNLTGGSVFGKTGDTGLGTGPHLDLRKVRAMSFENVDRSGKSHVPITKFETYWILTGSSPKDKAPEEL